MFYTEGICLDLSHKGLRELIEITDLEHALSEASLKLAGDTVLLYTDHYRRAFEQIIGSMNQGQHGRSAMARPAQIAHLALNRCHRVWSTFLIKKFIVSVGVGFYAYENMINLYQLIGRGVFAYCLPLRIRGGTGSPVRALPSRG